MNCGQSFTACLLFVTSTDIWILRTSRKGSQAVEIYQRKFDWGNYGIAVTYLRISLRVESKNFIGNKIIVTSKYRQRAWIFLGVKRGPQREGLQRGSPRGGVQGAEFPGHTGEVFKKFEKINGNFIFFESFKGNFAIF